MSSATFTPWALTCIVYDAHRRHYQHPLRTAILVGDLIDISPAVDAGAAVAANLFTPRAQGN